MAKILKVANIYFNMAGTSNIAYLNDNVVRIRANSAMLPVGSTSNRPTGEPGLIRYNSDTHNFEGYNANSWGAIGGAADVSAPFNTANAAFNKANSANLFVIDAFTKANLANTIPVANTMSNNYFSIRSSVRSVLNFIPATGVTIDITDDSAGDRANITITVPAAAAAYDKANSANITADYGNTAAAAAYGKANAAVYIRDDTANSTPIQYVLIAPATGNVGTINVSSAKLTFNANTGTLTATDFNSLSDIVYKDNILVIDSALDKVNKLHGITFNWKENGKPSAGLLAQELINTLPQVVSSTMTVNYSGVIALLVEAIKELNKKIEDLTYGK